MTQSWSDRNAKRPVYDEDTRAWLRRQADAVQDRRVVEPIHVRAAVTLSATVGVEPEEIR